MIAALGIRGGSNPRRRRTRPPWTTPERAAAPRSDTQPLRQAGTRRWARHTPPHRPFRASRGPRRGRLFAGDSMSARNPPRGHNRVGFGPLLPCVDAAVDRRERGRTAVPQRSTAFRAPARCQRKRSSMPRRVLRADPEPARTNDARASSSRVRLCASATMTSRWRLSRAATRPLKLVSASESL